MTEDWTGAVAAERMQLDTEFEDRVESSSFDRQQWGLIMTAVDLTIEDPADPERAAIVPDTSSLPAIMPELDRVAQQGGMAGGGGGATGGGGGGLVDSVKGALGLGDGSDERVEEATELAEEYCERLQERLESSGRWDDVRERAQE